MIFYIHRYSECKDDEVTKNSNGTSYYVANLGLKAGTESVSSKLGMCFPESCTPEDVNTLTNTSVVTINNILKKHNISSVRCFNIIQYLVLLFLSKISFSWSC